MTRTRFAPSPTGDLHLGGAWTALASWALARRRGGRTVLRMEDLDRPRVRAGAADRILDDLARLGLDWDEGPREGGSCAPYTQSERDALHEAALAELARKGLVYPCDCSRKEIAERAASEASAPHGSELRYPGTCRDKPVHREMKRDPALRLRVPEDAEVAFVDAVQGPVRERVAAAAGDFVLRRADGMFAYQLAVSIDDWAMGITDVVRGADLLPSTARQLLLVSLVGASWSPTTWHVPLVISAEGERLAKRAALGSIRDLFTAGLSGATILGKLAHGLGLAADDRPRQASDLATGDPAPAFRREPWVAPSLEEWTCARTAI